jgi:hypothetical protein
LGRRGQQAKKTRKTRIALRGKAIHHLHPSTILVLQFDTVALCSACGTELGADARFCRNCGRPAADTAFARATSEPLGDAEIEKTLPTILQYSRRTRTPWYLAISGFVGIICEFIDITLNTRQSAVPGFAALVVFAVLYASDKAKEKFVDWSVEREQKFKHSLRGRLELMRTIPIAPSIKQKDDLAKAIHNLLIGRFPAKLGFVVAAGYQPGSYNVSNGNLCACEIKIGIEPSPPRNDLLKISDTSTFCVSVIARRYSTTYNVSLVLAAIVLVALFLRAKYLGWAGCANSNPLDDCSFISFVGFIVSFIALFGLWLTRTKVMRSAECLFPARDIVTLFKACDGFVVQILGLSTAPLGGET